MNKLTKKQTEELNFVAALPDDLINTSDIPEQTDWNNARVGRFYSADRGNIEVDGDILEWFKAKSSRHYQQLINKALRDYIERPPRQ